MDLSTTARSKSRRPAGDATGSHGPSPIPGLLQHLQVVYQRPVDLKPAPRNVRIHSPAQLHQIARSIEAFGFVNPILVNADNQVVAGHGRLAAAQALGLAEVPTLRLEHLTPAAQRAYALADNRLAELAGWDQALLALELADLAILDAELDLTLTGFEIPEIEGLWAESAGPPGQDPDDELPEAGPPITRVGDLWQIGPHRLVCGDATQASAYEQLLAGEGAELILTDPPYNVKIDGHVSGLGKTRHREFVMASGEMSRLQFTAFLRRAFTQLATHSRNGSIHYIFMDWRHLQEVLEAGQAVYTELKNLCVWVKTVGGLGSLYRSRHELCFVFKSGKAKHVNHVELGRFGRYRTNVWEFAGANTFRAGRDQDLADHPTVKPVAMLAEAIKDCSRPKSIVLDAFAGSGSTLLAAHRTGRRGFGLELDPRYCDVILRRLHRQTGVEPVRASGERFTELAAHPAITPEG